MRVSDCVKVFGAYRLYRKAISLQASIERRQEWASQQRLLRPEHMLRIGRVLSRLNTFTTQLDSNEFISHTPAPLLRPVKETMAYCFEGIDPPGKAQHDDLTAAFVENMNMKGRRKRAGEHSFALTCEVADKAKRGWFFVFNTLTVEPGSYASVFVDGAAFSEYIRRVDRAVASAAYGSIRASAGRDYHTYFAAVEEGKLRGRLHIHVLHFCAALPRGSQDPNTGLYKPLKRQIETFRPFWKHGHSNPIAVRWSHNDAFGALGWRWPLDRKTQQGLKTGSAFRVAGYVAKYVSKSYLSQKRSELLWRVRKSQKLGRVILDQVCSRLTIPQLAIVASDPSMRGRLNNQVVPPEMMRLAALRSLADRSTGSLHGTLRELSPLPSPLLSLRGSSQIQCMSSRPNIGPITTLVSDVEGTSEDAWRALDAACVEVDREYFATTTHPFVHSTGVR